MAHCTNNHKMNSDNMSQEEDGTKYLKRGDGKRHHVSEIAKEMRKRLDAA